MYEVKYVVLIDVYTLENGEMRAINLSVISNIYHFLRDLSSEVFYIFSFLAVEKHAGTLGYGHLDMLALCPIYFYHYIT